MAGFFAKKNVYSFSGMGIFSNALLTIFHSLGFSPTKGSKWIQYIAEDFSGAKELVKNNPNQYETIKNDIMVSLQISVACATFGLLEKSFFSKRSMGISKKSQL